MTDERWLLIKGDEDGNPLRWLDERGLQELLSDPVGSYGVRRFLAFDGANEPDPNYWRDGDALLLRVQPVVPRAVVTAYELP